MKKILFIVCIAMLTIAGSCKKEIPAGCIDKNKIDPNRPCIAHVDPVCGCDKKTYGNSCEAEKAGVTSYTKGKCK